MLPTSGEREKIEQYLGYAEELRAMAGRMSNAEARRIVLTVAEDYERLAAQLQAQLKPPCG